MESCLKIKNVKFAGNGMIISDSSKKIKLCDSILKIMKEYIQSSPKACEAGGILIGRENSGNENLIIEYATRPMEHDKRSRRKYIRKDKNHLLFYQELYEKSDKIYAYIGEWHTHPENKPNYSYIDESNWKRIGKIMNRKNQYHIIVGIMEIGIWQYNSDSKIIKKISSIEWNRIEQDETFY